MRRHYVVHMLRGSPASWVARTVALLAVACVPATQGAWPAVQQAGPREFADAAGSGVHGALPTVRWVTEHAGERRIDVYAFDCARGRYAHVLSERYSGALRVERIALAEERWDTALRPLPPKYPALAVHRARAIACAPAGRAR